MRNIILALLAALLTACGSKGGLSPLPRSEPNPPLLTQAAQKMGWLPSSADQAACAKRCESACPSRDAAGTLRPPVNPWPDGLNGIPLSSLSNPEACNSACVSRCPAGFAAQAADDNKPAPGAKPMGVNPAAK